MAEPSASRRIALSGVGFLLLALLAGCYTQWRPVAECPIDASGAEAAPPLCFESHLLTNAEAPITLQLVVRPATLARHPVILMPGSLRPMQLPEWSTNLIDQGYMVAAFTAAHAPDPDPAGQPQGIESNDRSDHSTVLGTQPARADLRRVVDYLTHRADVDSDKLSWHGSSAAGITSLAVATRDASRSAAPSQINAASHGDRVEAETAPAGPKLEWVQVAKDRRGFVQSPSGRVFIPWGFNYDRDYKSRLLEDYWQTEWPTVVQDFGAMKRLGVNVVRVHLQFAKFMEGPTEPNRESLGQLGRLLQLAESTGLYLDLTGLACYRRKDVPVWYSSLSESNRWAAQARFWEGIAKTCAASPAVFCYDLANEPMVPDGKRQPGDWLAGDLGGFTYCQFISLDQAGRARPDIARYWVAQLCAAIRRHDARHLLTVGLLPWSLETPVSASGFPPRKIAAPLDLICVHLYPRSGHVQDDLKLLAGFNIGKPVVVEEIFPLNCSAAELGEFIRASRPEAAGWLGFYWGQTPEELAQSTNSVDRLTRDWLRLFQKLNPNR